LQQEGDGALCRGINGVDEEARVSSSLAFMTGAGAEFVMSPPTGPFHSSAVVNQKSASTVTGT